LNIYIRRHWSIENQLHWQLDVIFLEDAQSTKAAQAAENFATLRNLALQLLNQVQDKESSKNRRKIAGWNNEYLTKVLANI